MKIENAREIQVYKGDCLALLRNLPDGSVDMLLTDLPYGTTNCKWDVQIDLDDLWKEISRVVKSGGCKAMCYSVPDAINYTMEKEKSRFQISPDARWMLQKLYDIYLSNYYAFYLLNREYVTEIKESVAQELFGAKGEGARENTAVQAAKEIEKLKEQLEAERKSKAALEKELQEKTRLLHSARKRENALLERHARELQECKKNSLGEKAEEACEKESSAEGQVESVREGGISSPEHSVEPVLTLTPEECYEALTGLFSQYSIVVVGGGRTFIRKLRNRYPKLSVVDTKAPSTWKQHAENAELILFKCDNISHSCYDRFKNIALSRNCPYDHLEKFNSIELIEQDIYKKIKKIFV